MKLLVLQGIPASGKSTYAKQWVSENPKIRVIVSRDAIRIMLGDSPLKAKDKLVDQIESNLVHMFLKQGYDVCLDATNLSDKKIQWCNELVTELSKENYSVDLEFKVFKVPLKDAIERDKNRSVKVGAMAIAFFYKKYNAIIGFK